MVNPFNDGVLGEGGFELIGSQLPLDDLILAARKRYEWLPFCVVKDWVILDAILRDERAVQDSCGWMPAYV